MIGATGLPMTKAVATTPARAHADASAETAPAPHATGEHGPAAQGRPHHAEGEATRGHREPRDPQSADRGRHGDTAAKTAATRRAAHAPRQPRGTRDDGDAAQDDAFARLLEPEATARAASTDKAVAPAPPATTPEKPPATGTLPDQLLGLLASLAPGANAAATPPAAAVQPAPPSRGGVPTGALPGAAGAASPAPQPGAAAGAPANGKAAAGNGSDALAALLPTLQGTGGPVAAATATHADAAAAPVATPHAGNAGDAPTAANFDALMHVAATAPAPVADSTRPIASAPAPLAQPADPRNGYGDELGGNVVWMAEQRLGHAQLHVTPEHLGPIEVRLQLDGSQVQASFLSAQPDVRHALEASLPRLRELLGQHGLQLAQADVGQRQQDPRGLPMQRNEADGRDPADDGLAPALPPRMRVVRGLLDEYA